MTLLNARRPVLTAVVIPKSSIGQRDRNLYRLDNRLRRLGVFRKAYVDGLWAEVEPNVFKRASGVYLGPGEMIVRAASLGRLVRTWFNLTLFHARE